MSSAVAIETRGLTRVFGDYVAVDRIDLSVREGSIYGFLGLNGAGKTTTLKMLTTLLKPSSGTAHIMGFDVEREYVDVRANIGVLAELEGITQPFWTPEEYLHYFARLQGIPKETRDARIQQLLKTVGLTEVRKVPIGTFSAGMKRKVEILRALIHEPPVLFLDEPTRELDVTAKVDIWVMLERLVADNKTTVFLLSHDVLEMERLVDELAVIRKGKIAHRGHVSDLKRTSIVRIGAPDPESVTQRLKSIPLVKDTWTERGAVYAELTDLSRRADLLRALVMAGVQVEEFAAKTKLDEALAELLREAPIGDASSGLAPAAKAEVTV
ncbi:MAG TPA: ABC transporter ATP-binding protein [Candidatus Thermoplasmatota archaeon]|nr:ABC transporter ATP-binding protein [Candidatus Thermoplasmatota archaeon]